MIQLWKTNWWYLNRLKTGLVYDPAISVLGIYPKDLKTGTQIFVHTDL